MTRYFLILLLTLFAYGCDPIATKSYLIIVEPKNVESEKYLTVRTESVEEIFILVKNIEEKHKYKVYSLDKIPEKGIVRIHFLEGNFRLSKEAVKLQDEIIDSIFQKYGDTATIVEGRIEDEETYYYMKKNIK